MSRKNEAGTKRLGRLRKAANTVKRMLGRGGIEEAESAGMEAQPLAQQASGKRTPAVPARTTRRQTDIPLDVIDRAYTPAATSSKASFRSDGADHQQDQEFVEGVSDNPWRDEDRLTNHSGDPRIGTRGRTYEPEEARPESRD